MSSSNRAIVKRGHAAAAAANPAATAALIAQSNSLRPTLALVLGSGFQPVLDAIKIVRETPYDDLPGFPPVGVSGHAGTLVLGLLGGTPVLVLSGRAHFYEGHSLELITFPIRVLAEFGIRDVLLTNAAGGINRRFRAGDFMAIEDHLNFMGANPLLGAPQPGRAQFVDLSEAYSPALRELLVRAARATKTRLHRGVYLAVSGPSYETPAEIRAFAKLGADAVGMSTVPEAIVARQCGLNVAGLSCITNVAAGLGAATLDHADVLAQSHLVATRTVKLLEQFARFYAETH